jgi:hypothetical protein
VDTPTPDDIRALFDHYLSHGCPCRFPRFRATVARNMKEVGASQWDVSDIGQLLATFDRRVPLVVEKRQDFMTQGRCSICEARVVRSGAPVFRDSFLERAEITPGPLPDLGAEVLWIVPVCGPIFPAAPVNVTTAERARIEQAYPRLPPKEWLAYMAALATTA